MEIINKKFSENSHIPLKEQEKARHIYKKDLIQPRDGDGELNREFLEVHGAKNIRISEHDIRRVAKHNPCLERKLTEQFKEQQRK